MSLRGTHFGKIYLNLRYISIVFLPSSGKESNMPLLKTVIVVPSPTEEIRISE